MATTERQSSLRRFRWLITIVLSLAILVYLLLQIQVEDLRRLWETARPEWVMPALGLYLLTQLLRGWRLRLLARGKSPLLRLGAVAAVQGLLLTILPMRTGEISFVALLARERGLGVARAGKMLVAVRLTDLAVVTTLFIIASQLLPTVRTPLLVLLPAVLLVALCVGLVAWPQALARVLQPLSRWALALPGLRRWRVKSEGVVEQALTVADPEWFRSLLPALWAQSALIWLASMAVNYAALQAVGLGLSTAAVIYVTTVTVVSTVLPIYGPAGYGAQDAVGAAVFLVLGLGRAEAIAAQLGWHTLSLMLCIISGGLGSLYLTLRPVKPEE